MIRVATGVIISPDKRIFLTQRKPDMAHPFAWETPGGKEEPMDQGNLSMTLERELLEELRVPCNAGRFLFRADCGTFSVHYYMVHFASQYSKTGLGLLDHPVSLTAAVGSGWFSAEELTGLVLTPGNAARKAELVQLINTGGVSWQI